MSVTAVSRLSMKPPDAAAGAFVLIGERLTFFFALTLVLADAAGVFLGVFIFFLFG
jgi:hypothetical protein